AADLWQRALAENPNDADAHHGLGLIMVMRGDARRGIDHFREALRIDPNRPDTLSSLAWTLATHPNPAFQNGSEAVKLARRAVELKKDRDPFLLDILAAALARDRDFDEAARVAKEAADLADQQSKHDLAAS